MSTLDYIKEEGKNLKAENMLKHVTVVTELTTARKFQVRVLTPYFVCSDKEFNIQALGLVLVTGVLSLLFVIA